MPWLGCLSVRGVAHREYSGGKVLPKHLFWAWDNWTNDAVYAGLTLAERDILGHYGQSACFLALVSQSANP